VKNGIGTLNEMSLHAALKTWYKQPGDKTEVGVDGYVVDIVRDDLLVEIQTGNFSTLKRKLLKLIADYQIRLVYPIPHEKWILRFGSNDVKQISKRKSPKRGRVEHLFSQLVSFPDLVTNPNFSIEVLLTQEEEHWKNDGKGSWRRKRWSISDRHLIEVLDRVELASVRDYQDLLPARLPAEFTTVDLVNALGISRRLAQQMAYCLRAMGAISQIGKRRNAYLYTIES